MLSETTKHDTCLWIILKLAKNAKGCIVTKNGYYPV